MTRWFRGLWAEWNDDDPAIRRGKGPESPQDSPQTPLAAEVAQLPVKPRPVALDPAERRAQIAALVARLEVEAGDTVAADQLRKLLDGNG